MVFCQKCLLDQRKHALFRSKISMVWTGVARQRGQDFSVVRQRLQRGQGHRLQAELENVLETGKASNSKSTTTTKWYHIMLLAKSIMSKLKYLRM
jgi:hypothetical protein